MSNVVSQSVLLKKAVLAISEQKQQFPNKSLDDIIDSIAMEFNLSPLDVDSLLRILNSDNENYIS